MNIKFNRNKKSWFCIKFIKSFKMASGEFIWFLGDDDLLVRNSIKNLINKMNNNKDVDFFGLIFLFKLITSSKFPKPFDTKNLPKSMIPHSKLRRDRKTNFLEFLIKRCHLIIYWNICLRV